MSAHDRILVLLQMLGAMRQVELAKANVRKV
jgi:hypothetical protein